MPIVIIREVVKREQAVPGLGEKIKRAQVDSGVSIEKLIRAINISRTYWHRIVGDEDMVLSVELLRQIEDFLGINFGVDFEEK